MMGIKNKSDFEFQEDINAVGSALSDIQHVIDFLAAVWEVEQVITVEEVLATSSAENYLLDSNINTLDIFLNNVQLYFVAMVNSVQ